jgi:hypothetical protein
MSERIQRTSKSMSESMLNRYPDGLHHKHDKNHKQYRQHCRTHPCQHPNYLNEYDDTRKEIANGLLKEFKMRKTRKRFDKGQIH